jgi:hypothetical protein
MLKLLCKIYIKKLFLGNQNSQLYGCHAKKKPVMSVSQAEFEEVQAVF